MDKYIENNPELNPNEMGNPADPFYNPPTDNYCSEKEASIGLTADEIRMLGFFRTNPERRIYQHRDKPNLYLLITTVYNFSVKDLAEEIYEVWYHPIVNTVPTLVYSSTKPNKEDIQQVINSYAS